MPPPPQQRQHFVPQALDVPGVPPEDDRREEPVHNRRRDLGRAPRDALADADQPGVGRDADEHRVERGKRADREVDRAGRAGGEGNGGDRRDFHGAVFGPAAGGSSDRVAPAHVATVSFVPRSR